MDTAANTPAAGTATASLLRRRLRRAGSVSGFGRLWVGQTASVFGTQVTFLALPLVAVGSLGASPGQMGLLAAVDNLPYLLFGLGVGVLVDRLPRRGLMIGTDLVRALTLATIPVAAILGVLTLAQLFVVVFVVGACTIAFDVAYQVQLPDLVPDGRLVEANARLETTRSLSFVAGPGLGGILVQLVTAPIAIAADAVSYVASAACIRSIREPETPPRPTGDGVRRDIADGLRLIRDDGRLRGLAVTTASASLALNAWLAVLVVYLVRVLGLDAGAVGLVYVVHGAGGIAGALVVPRISSALGVGRVLAAMPLVAGLGGLLVPLAGGPGIVRAAGIGSGAILLGFGLVGLGVTSAGLRQVLAPSVARGRVMATLRFFEWGVMPIGSLAGGAIGEVLGPGPALAIGAVALASTTALVLASPLVRIRVLPAAAA